MSNAFLEHHYIIDNFVAEVRNALKGSTCKVQSDGVQYKWKETGDKIFIPDASIVCSAKDRQNTILHTVPRMVLEVLSKSTEEYDRGEKLQLYANAGISEVWLLDWTKRTIEVFLCDDDGTGKGWKPYPSAVYTDNNKEQLHFDIFPNIKLDFDAIMDIAWLSEY